jgi:hypothetical protein
VARRRRVADGSAVSRTAVARYVVDVRSVAAGEVYGVDGVTAPLRLYFRAARDRMWRSSSTARKRPMTARS